MAELQQVMKALRSTEFALNGTADPVEKKTLGEEFERLAIIANRLKPSGDSEQGQINYGTLPFINRAISKTFGAPVDLIRGGLNLIPGVDLPTPVGGSESIESGMKAAGITLPEKGREPQTISEQVGRGIGEAASFMIPGGAGIKALSKGAGLSSKIADTMLKTMVKHPYIAMTSELSGGAGAGGGGAAARELFPDSPTANVVGEMVGGITGGMIPTLYSNRPMWVAIRAGEKVIRKMSLPFTKRGAKFRAGEHLKQQVVSPEDAARRVTDPTIGELPPAVALGEKRLTALYKTLIGQDPVTDSDAINKLSRSIIKLESEMRKIGYGSPELLAEITQQRVTALELRIDQRIMSAMDNAQARVDALPVAQRKVAESRIVRNELEAAMATEKASEQALWVDVPKDIEVGFANTRATYKDIIDNLSEAQKIDVPGILRSSHIIKSKKGVATKQPAGFGAIATPKKPDATTTSLREMQGLRSKLLEVARISRKNSKWNTARISQNMADAILDDVEKTASEVDASSLHAAIAATKQFKTRYEQGIVGKILGYSKTGAPAIDPDLTLDISIGRMGAKGSVDLEKIAITPEAQNATKRYLARSFTDFSTNKKTGTINPSQADSWIKNNEAILDKFPGVRNELSDISSAQTVADKTRISMNARKKNLRDPKISTAARFLNAADLGLEVESIFKSKNPARMASELSRKAAKDSTGEAIAGLRGGVIDHILEKSSVTGSFNAQGERTWSGSAILDFTNSNLPALRQIFDPEKIGRIRQIGNELLKIEQFEKARGGTSDIEMKDRASSLIRLAARLTGAQVGRVVAGATGGGTVQTPGIFSERFRAFASKLTKQSATELIHDAVISNNPELLRTLLMPIDKPTSKRGQDVLKLLDQRMNLWLGGTGSRVMRDVINEMKEDGDTGLKGNIQSSTQERVAPSAPARQNTTPAFPKLFDQFINKNKMNPTS